MPANDGVTYFPSDYRGDAGVESLDYAGRGLWHEMYVLMMTTGGYLEYCGKPVRESDLSVIAKATRGALKDVQRIFPQIRESGVYSLTDDGTIYCRKLVAHFAKRAGKSRAGAQGGKKTAQANAQARAQAELLKQNPEHPLEQSRQALSVPIHSDLDQLASLADSAREATHTSRSLKSPAYAFCEWLLDRGVESGAIPEHHRLDPAKFCLPQVEAAETLERVYGLDEGRLRVERFIAARTAKPPRIRRTLTVQAVLDAWDWAELRDDSTQQTASEDGLVASIRASQAAAEVRYAG